MSKSNLLFTCIDNNGRRISVERFPNAPLVRVIPGAADKRSVVLDLDLVDGLIDALSAWADSWDGKEVF